MPTVSISSLWTPQIWIKTAREQQATFPSIFNSRAVQRNLIAEQLANGPGTDGEIPFYKDITDQADEIQVEGTAPSTINGITAGKMKATILNRVSKNQAEALAAAVSGSDPVPEMVGQMTERRLKQRQSTMLAMMRGIFGTGTGHAIGVAAPLQAVRKTVAQETTVGLTAANLISPDVFIDACTLLGELQNNLRPAALFLHPVVKAQLQKLDASSFKSGVQSGLAFDITTYRDIPLFLSDALVRAGTTSGFVYDSYILTPGSFAYGDKPQAADTIDAASLQMDMDKDKNSEIIYDRTRFVLHPYGLRLGGTPAGQSATNAELGTIANWSLVVSSASRSGMVAIQTNG